MKRIILGGFLFVGGLAGVLLIIAFSIVYPCSINGITGFEGFLISYDIMLFFYNVLYFGFEWNNSFNNRSV